MTASPLSTGRAQEAGAPSAFFNRSLRAFEEAVERSTAGDVHLRVANRVVQLRFAGDALVPAIMPALSHLEMQVPIDRAPALRVGMFDTESTGVVMPPPVWGPNDWGPKGEIVGFNDDRIRTVYQPGVDILHLFDADRDSAIYWVPNARTIPWWESSFPLRTILHWWAAGSSVQPAHSGAVARAGVGVLIAGESGTGKSTTTLACLAAGLDYLGDDYVMVDVDEPSVHSLYSTAKLEPENLRRFPQLVPLIANPDQLQTQKAMLFVHDHFPDRVVLDAPLGAILLPRITRAGRTTISAAPASAAMSSLAPTTLFHLPGFGREVVAKFSRLVRTVPSYWLDVGEDLTEVAKRVDDFVGGLR